MRSLWYVQCALIVFIFCIPIVCNILAKKNRWRLTCQVCAIKWYVLSRSFESHGCILWRSSRPHVSQRIIFVANCVIILFSQCQLTAHRMCLFGQVYVHVVLVTRHRFVHVGAVWSYLRSSTVTRHRFVCVWSVYVVVLWHVIVVYV